MTAVAPEVLSDIANSLKNLQLSSKTQGEKFTEVIEAQQAVPGQIQTAIAAGVGNLKEVVLAAVDTKIDEKLAPMAERHDAMEQTIAEVVEKVSQLQDNISAVEAQQT